MEIGDWRSMLIRSKIVEIGDWRSQSPVLVTDHKKWRLEIGDWRSIVEIGDWRSDSGDWRLEVADWSSFELQGHGVIDS